MHNHFFSTYQTDPSTRRFFFRISAQLHGQAPMILLIVAQRAERATGLEELKGSTPPETTQNLPQ